MQKLYSESSISNIADAIRAKGGTGTFTVGEMAQAIEDLPSGGGFTIDDVINKTFPETVTYSGNKDPVGSLFSGSTTIKHFSAPNMVNLSSSLFSGCSNLESVDCPSVTTNNANITHVFLNCSKLTSVNLPKLRLLGQQAFRGCGFTTVVFKAMTELRPDVFDDCTHLTGADFPSLGYSYQAFMRCTNLNTLVLRRTSAIVGLANTMIFNNTPFAVGATHSGHIYVPSALISSYQTATNWSTFYNDYNDLFQPIEGSPYENYYVDGTPIE